MHTITRKRQRDFYCKNRNEQGCPERAALFPLLLALSAGAVDQAVAVQQNFGDGYNTITVGKQGFQNAGQGLGRVLGGIVEKDDASGLNPVQHPTCDLIGRDSFPVETIPACNK